MDGEAWEYQRQADKRNSRMRDYWRHFNPDGDMRICKYCKCNDDTISEGAYWLKEDECSNCVDASKEIIKPLDGTNQEDELKKSS